MNQKRRVRIYKTSKKDGDPEYEAWFHGWLQDYEEFHEGPGLFPAAIVEKDDGKVESVYAEKVAFVIE